MNNIKMLGLIAALAAASLATFASAALADNFTSPAGSEYTGSIVATSTNMTLNGAFVTVSCGHSELKATVQKHGFGVDPGGKVSSLTFTSCNYATTVKNAGSFDVDAEGAGSGDFDSFGAEISVATSVGTCVFTTSSAFGTDLGYFTGNSFGNASIDWGPGKPIPRTGGNFLCGSTGYFIGTFTVTTPTSLTVDGW